MTQALGTTFRHGEAQVYKNPAWTGNTSDLPHKKASGRPILGHRSSDIGHSSSSSPAAERQLKRSKLSSSSRLTMTPPPWPC
jgi:hypothetical protein